jgi:hypothetical protein
MPQKDNESTLAQKVLQKFELRVLHSITASTNDDMPNASDNGSACGRWRSERAMGCGKAEPVVSSISF